MIEEVRELREMTWSLLGDWRKYELFCALARRSGELFGVELCDRMTGMCIYDNAREGQCILLCVFGLERVSGEIARNAAYAKKGPSTQNIKFAAL